MSTVASSDAGSERVDEGSPSKRQRRVYPTRFDWCARCLRRSLSDWKGDTPFSVTCLFDKVGDDDDDDDDEFIYLL